MDPNINFKSASVMPCFYNVDEKEMYYLIGKEGSKFWCDFGGKRDDQEKPFQTASRELNEETIQALDSVAKNIKNDLKYTFKVQIGSHVLFISCMNHSKTHHQGNNGERLTRYQARSLRDSHQVRLMTPGLPSCQREKKDLAWLKASDVINKENINGQINFTAYPEPRDYKAGMTQVNLRNCFAKTLETISKKIAPEFFKSGFEELHGQQLNWECYSDSQKAAKQS